MLATGGCSDPLKVENPDVIPPGDVDNILGLPVLYAGAVGDFAVAYSGDGVTTATEGLILVSGSFSDELGNSETFPTRKEYDQRTIDLRNPSLDAVFRNLQNARRSAEVAASAFERLHPSPDTDPRTAESFGLAGMSYLLLGENYCSGIPVSYPGPGGELEFGIPLATAQIFERALSHFDAALRFSANATVANLARVGRGRVLLNLGRFAEASAAVDEVPVSFLYRTTHTTSTGRQQNGIFVFINQSERWSVANRDGGNGIDFRDARDPRVPWARIPANDLGFDNSTPQFDQGKYAGETAPVAVASGVEAELIRAEAALFAGDAVAWLGRLNGLRASTSLYPSSFPAGFPAAFPVLAPLTDPGSNASRVDLMFRERAFWLYLTAHRMGDMRRMVRQYGRSAADVFPGGNGAPYVINGNPKGGFFGIEVNLPVPFSETNNPNFQACLDRNP